MTERPSAWDGSVAPAEGEVKLLRDRPRDGSSVRPSDLAWRVSVDYFARFGRWCMTTLLVFGETRPPALVREALAARALVKAQERAATGTLYSSGEADRPRARRSPTR